MTWCRAYNCWAATSPGREFCWWHHDGVLDIPVHKVTVVFESEVDYYIAAATPEEAETIAEEQSSRHDVYDWSTRTHAMGNTVNPDELPNDCEVYVSRTSRGERGEWVPARNLTMREPSLPNVNPNQDRLPA